MRYSKLLFFILSVIVVITIFGLGVGITIAYIQDKLGNQYLWFAFILILVLSITFSIRISSKEKKDHNTKKIYYLTIGQFIFKNLLLDFNVFYTNYLQNNNTKTKEVCRPIDAILEFAESKALVTMVDWRGEDDGEIEEYITAQVKLPIKWTYSNKLRIKNAGLESHDGKYIIQVFKAADKDLKAINKKLLFLDNGDDSYYFVVVDINTFREILKFKSDDFHGTEFLKQ